MLEKNYFLCEIVQIQKTIAVKYSFPRYVGNHTKRLKRWVSMTLYGNIYTETLI